MASSENKSYKPLHTERGLSLLGSLLEAVYWVDESLQESLTQRGFPRISRTWSMVMVNIANGVHRPIAIAKNIGVSRQAMQKTLQDMSAAELIDIMPDPSDKRATIVNFSPRGRPIQEAATEILGDIEVVLTKRIGKAKLNRLHEALETDWGDLALSASSGSQSSKAD